MKFTKEGVDRSVYKLSMASGYDVTIKLYQHHVIERVTRGHVLFNTRAKTNHIDSTRPALLSMNKLATEYWDSYAIWNLNIQNIKILGIKPKL